MTAEAFDFFLPEELNATYPPERRGVRRDHVRMMVLERQTGKLSHDGFYCLPDYLRSGDLMILNNSRTVPAILHAKYRRSPHLEEVDIEVRLAKRRSEDIWEALILAEFTNLDDLLIFSTDLTARIIGQEQNSPIKTIKFSKKGTDLYDSIYSLGEPIRYEYITQPWSLDYYQTVFASHPGSVEMPSAGRAFSWELFFNLQKKGVNLDFIQLHTGLSYLMDEKWEQSPEKNEEEYVITPSTMRNILKARASGGRVLAVGTTVVRALESAARSGRLEGWTNLYINRDFPLKLVDGILTGLHEPKASHLELLSAFVSESDLLSAYEEAVKHRYLWHEFGDMNLIL